jgi:hypothetical protein
LHGDLYYFCDPLAFYRIHAMSTGAALHKNTVADFLHVVARLEHAGGPRLSSFQKRRIAALSWIKSWLRYLIYRTLASR